MVSEKRLLHLREHGMLMDHHTIPPSGADWVSDEEWHAICDLALKSLRPEEERSLARATLEQVEHILTTSQVRWPGDKVTDYIYAIVKVALNAGSTTRHNDSPAASNAFPDKEKS